jgi:hypothetical protein
MCLWSSLSKAYVVANGRVELGIAQEEQETNFGIGANYKLSSVENNYAYTLNSNMQVGSDEGRSLIATSAHNYQYESSYIKNYVSLNFPISKGYISWGNQFYQSIEFEKDNDEYGAISTDYEDNQVSWTFTSGPIFTVKRSKWISYKAGLELSRQYTAGDISSEYQIYTEVNKSLSHISNVTLRHSYVCTEKISLCRQSIISSFEIKKKISKLKINFGVSKKVNNDKKIYRFDYVHTLNSTSKFQFLTYQSFDSISNITDIELENSRVAKTSKKNAMSLNYFYEWGRKNIGIKARELKSSDDGITLKSKNSMSYYEYQLGSQLCRACTIGMSYEYANFGNSITKKISGITIKKNNNRHLSSSIIFSRTKLSNSLDLWSLNFLLSYSGSALKMGQR